MHDFTTAFKLLSVNSLVEPHKWLFQMELNRFPPWGIPRMGLPTCFWIVPKSFNTSSEIGITSTGKVKPGSATEYQIVESDLNLSGKNFLLDSITLLFI